MKTTLGRNPTFTGCGFHIFTDEQLREIETKSQSYFHWMRVSYGDVQIEEIKE